MIEDKDVIAEIVGVKAGSGLAEVLATRADIMVLTQKSHEAALTPVAPGGLSHAERAALACRVAKLNNDRDFERHFEMLLEQADVSGEAAQIADMWFRGGDDRRLTALIRHTDLIAHEPRNASRGDIELLQDAGLSDADIVRLSELVAFVSYQIRVAAGLRLMRGRA
jgi:CMD domain protein